MAIIIYIITTVCKNIKVAINLIMKLNSVPLALVIIDWTRANAIQ